MIKLYYQALFVEPTLSVFYQMKFSKIPCADAVSF